MSLREHTELPTRKLNRLSARTPQSGLYWCSCCDRDLISAGQKCATCGARSPRNVMRKRDVV